MSPSGEGVFGLLLWGIILVGFAAAAAALYGRYRPLPALLTGPEICKLEDGGCGVLFRSRNAALIGIPNSLLGLLFYAFLVVGVVQGWPAGLLLAGATLALGMTLYLAWVLIRQRLECRICWTGHVANTLLWLLLLRRLLLAPPGTP